MGGEGEDILSQTMNLTLLDVRHLGRDRACQLIFKVKNMQILLFYLESKCGLSILWQGRLLTFLSGCAPVCRCLSGVMHWSEVTLTQPLKRTKWLWCCSSEHSIGRSTDAQALADQGKRGVRKSSRIWMCRPTMPSKAAFLKPQGQGAMNSTWWPSDSALHLARYAGRADFIFILLLASSVTGNADARTWL